ncbi:MAG: hypothetical protein RI947_645 [Candidatus Parcubacteria bacterium]|jgi:cytochrome oxidase assembly protein ShyY1
MAKKQGQSEQISKVMFAITILLFILGIWQLVTRGVSLDNSSAIQFLTTAVILFSINPRNNNK